MDSLFGSEAATPPKAPARNEAAHRGPEGRAPRAQPERDRARLLRALRSPPGPQDGQARPRGRAHPFEVRAPLPALPRDPRAQGRPGGRGRAARRRLEREGDLRLPAGRQLHRLPDPEAVGGGRAGGPGGQAARQAPGRAQGDAEGDGGDPPLPGEPEPRRVPHPRGAGPDRHTPQPQDLRANTRPQPRALRPREAEGTGQGEEGDAIRGDAGGTSSGARTSVTWTTGASAAGPT